MKTKQIVFTAPHVAELLDVECLPPKENEVTVELSYSAISAGTEKANFIGARNNTAIAEGTEPVFPRTVGYSAAGVVTETGAAVKSVHVGDRVVVFWGKHKKNITVSEHNVIRIPDEVPTAEAALSLIATFPLAAIRKTKLEIGESAMVMGLGILGILAVQELRATAEGFADEVKRLTGGGVNVCIEVTGIGAGLIEALDCMKRFGRVALLGCTRSSRFEIDYYGKVHGPGISLIGAHTAARPETESSPGLWTDRDDLQAVLNLVKGKRLNLKDMICEMHSPREAQTVYDRLVNERNFPIGVLFDWRELP